MRTPKWGRSLGIAKLCMFARNKFTKTRWGRTKIIHQRCKRSTTPKMHTLNLPHRHTRLAQHPHQHHKTQRTYQHLYHTSQLIYTSKDAIFVWYFQPCWKGSSWAGLPVFHGTQSTIMIPWSPNRSLSLANHITLHKSHNSIQGRRKRSCYTHAWSNSAKSSSIFVISILKWSFTTWSLPLSQGPFSDNIV